MTLGERLREFREERGLTQSELGRKASLTPAAVWQIENNNRKPSAVTLEKLARALVVSMDALMGRETDEALLGDDSSARVLLRGYQQLTSDDRDAVRGMVEALRRKRKGDKDR